MSEQSIIEFAQRLDNAWKTRAPIAPFSESDGLTSVDDAYAVQTHWANTRIARGERGVGRKIGLTSKAIQQQLGVNEPDYGAMWESTYYSAENGHAEAPASSFLQPRIEGEIAFLIGRRLEGANITMQEVLAAAEATALSAEIVDSRIADWRIKLVDTIADNASYGGFVHGPWDRRMLETDLDLLGMTVHHNGALAAEGVGAAAMGHPALSVAWLANKLSSFEIMLEPGDIVLSGGIVRMLPAKQGDSFVFRLFGQPALTVTFT